MYSGEENDNVSFASYLVRLRTTSETLPAYFSYLLNVEGLLGIARADAFIAIGQCNLNPTRYGLIRIARPPLHEQTAIVEFLDAETAKIDTLTAESERAIELLQERRTALISAAVTGKIDVRNHQEKETA
jgi:type I restriction enzyme S subunit